MCDPCFTVSVQSSNFEVYITYCENKPKSESFLWTYQHTGGTFFEVRGEGAREGQMDERTERGRDRQTVKQMEGGRERGREGVKEGGKEGRKEGRIEENERKGRGREKWRIRKYK